MALAAFGAVLGAGGVVGLTTPAQAATAIPAGCTHAPGTALVTCTFGYTGGVQHLTIPDGVTQVTLQAWGGRGHRPGSYQAFQAVAVRWFRATSR